MNAHDHPIQALSDSLIAALRWGFETPVHQRKDWKASQKGQGDVYKEVAIPLQPQDIEVVAMFEQMWGSTCLGFDGIGGAAMTCAYTVVLRHEHRVAVCFGGALAYMIDKPKTTFLEDLAERNIASVVDARRYGTVQKPNTL